MGVVLWIVAQSFALAVSLLGVGVALSLGVPMSAPAGVFDCFDVWIASYLIGCGIIWRTP